MSEKPYMNAIYASALSVFLLGCFITGPSLRNAVDDARALRSSGRDEANMRQRNESAFAQILGEVRTSMSDMMFVKTNRYLHAGIGYRVDPNSPNSRMSSSCAPGTPTLIRKQNNDFRWILGDLERQIKPFKDSSESHAHLTGDELTPWYRVMTLVNPNYIRAYRIGAKTLADENQWHQGLAFLEEGIRNNQKNPELFLLYQSLTSFHMRGRSRPSYPWGQSWAENALAAAEKSYSLAKMQRPPFGQSNKIQKDIVWTDDYEEEFRYCAHLIPLLLRQQGRLDEALQKARRSYADCPDFIPAKNLVEKLSGKSSVDTASAAMASANEEVSESKPQENRRMVDPLKVPLLEHMAKEESIDAGSHPDADLRIIQKDSHIEVTISNALQKRLGAGVLESLNMLESSQIMSWNRYLTLLDDFHELVVAGSPHGHEKHAHEEHEHQDHEENEYHDHEGGSHRGH